MLIVLQDLKTILKEILEDDVNTIKIGLEKGIASKSCPMVRVVPSVLKNDSVYKTLEFTIFLGVSKSKNDLENDYINLSSILGKLTDTLVVTELHHGLLKIEDIIFDEDKLDNIKLVAVRMTLNDYRD